MAINPALLGHGIFTEYTVMHALKRFSTYVSQNPANPPSADNIDRFINALRDMHISNVWIHLFSRGVDKEDEEGGSHEQRELLIKKLNAAQIPWAGWGYCAGATHDADLVLIKKFKTDSKIAMRAFVINSEPHKDNDKWPDNTFEPFVRDVKEQFSKNDIAISSWPVLYLHEDDHAHTLMQAAAPHVSAFAPQAYWLDKPLPSNYHDGYTEHDYPKHKPIAFIRLCLDDWVKYLNKWKQADPSINAELIVSGGAYWGSDGSLDREGMEGKLDEVVINLPDAQWARMIGFNWYHAGLPTMNNQKGSMSKNMVTSIAARKLHLKPYKQT